ncbi:2OG-Fe(II) oxygenase family protein [Aureliella helgolandensis]|uniref:Prolyl 4-hydroxylase alpha subunit Fe(2+) 2OG dioxygenase domain-containing protein n=1 Tax=Aureliella helgolandensis TaxID=2527968 RepID=A0A518G8R7_9BACT|nr:2OG-Fe(II) oxygenase family protein [Aureliella helgolandensis]QDV24973.1 hypothetical protein Q31a_32950 [Aureliella helgolandensis]
MSHSAFEVSGQQISLAFPTLLGRFQVPESDLSNPGLLKELLHRESSAPSRDYANVGGWHSSGNLLEWPLPEIVKLRGWISTALASMVRATGQLPEVQGRAEAPRGSFRLTAWGNVSRKGNYHRLHNHPNNAWSGVYYVTGDNSQETGLGGALELYDPRPFTEMVETPGNPYGQRLLVRPAAGLLVVFPSWLYHFVHPNPSDTLRVSIAFNAAWQSDVSQSHP